MANGNNAFVGICLTCSIPALSDVLMPYLAVVPVLLLLLPSALRGERIFDLLDERISVGENFQIMIGQGEDVVGGQEPGKLWTEIKFVDPFGFFGKHARCGKPDR